MHVDVDLSVLYFGTPVVLVSTTNPEGTTNLAPISSAWWLDDRCLIGVGDLARTSENLRRTGECVLNLPSSAQVDAVDRIAMTTGSDPVPDAKHRQGYRYVADKFAAAGLTRQPSDLVTPDRAEQCPIQLECRLVDRYSLGESRASAYQLEVVRTHVDESLVLPGTTHVDPVGWDPLIMKFCEFFGDGRPLRPSRLAAGWRMPHGAVGLNDATDRPATDRIDTAGHSR